MRSMPRLVPTRGPVLYFCGAARDGSTAVPCWANRSRKAGGYLFVGLGLHQTNTNIIRLLLTSKHTVPVLLFHVDFVMVDCTGLCFPYLYVSEPYEAREALTFV